MKNFRITLILIFFASFPTLLVFFYVAPKLLAPGSYSFAEIYEIGLPEDSLIAIINEIKAEYQEINLNKIVRTPAGKRYQLMDGRQEYSKYWYDFYFYYPDKNQIIKTWTRPKTNSITSFAFVSINDGLVLGKWEDVNSSLWWWKSDDDKELFEKRILSKILRKIKNNK